MKRKNRIHTTDTITLISRTLRRLNEAGTSYDAVDLTGLTVNFKMVNTADGSEAVAATAATIDTAADGEVSYDLQTADVATAGIFAVYFIVVDGSETLHFPAANNGDLIYIDSDSQSAEDAHRAALT